MRKQTWFLFAAAVFAVGEMEPYAAAHETSAELPPLVVIGRRENLIGIADTASQGRVGQEQISQRPTLRPAEVMESVPGLIITQHSGTGKANQYFLRGFNLDHGTDFAVSVDGVPINLPTHAHGQGYLDLNFIIPELIESIEYKKGPYYAGAGDFSSAGASDIRYADFLSENFVKLEGGEDNFSRAVVGQSLHLGEGHLLVGLDGQYQNGPWDVPEHYKRYSGLLKYALGDRMRGMSVSAMGYSGEWDSTDQIPQRAVDNGFISRLGSMDPTSGGRTARTGIAANYWNNRDGGKSNADLYLNYYRLNLWSNFTYFLDDPANGDQFEQADRRTIAGGQASHSWTTEAIGDRSETTVGLDARYDHIPNVALRRTKARDLISTVRQDHVKEMKSGLYISNETHWLTKFRSIAGLRGDAYWFDVQSDIPENSGSARDQILSPKLALIIGPWAETEYYVNWGLGFHSNDARGTTIRVDPASGSPAEKVSPLVRSRGAEAGLRTNIVPGLRSTVALWLLDLDSELLFVGDAGLTEPSRPSRRNGVEWSNYYQALPWLALDADLSLTHAAFRDSDPAGPQIPGAIERVVSAGVTAGREAGPFGGFRVRHFGPRPLIEDDSVRSKQSTICNLQIGYKTNKSFALTLDVLNVFDTEDHDIDYYYASQLSGEVSPVDDVHFHPVEPRTVRFSVAARF